MNHFDPLQETIVVWVIFIEILKKKVFCFLKILHWFTALAWLLPRFQTHQHHVPLPLYILPRIASACPHFNYLYNYLFLHLASTKLQFAILTNCLLKMSQSSFRLWSLTDESWKLISLQKTEVKSEVCIWSSSSSSTLLSDFVLI